MQTIRSDLIMERSAIKDPIIKIQYYRWSIKAIEEQTNQTEIAEEKHVLIHNYFYD